jgi:hypothetical protein
VSRGVGDQVRTVFGGGRTSSDVWETATAPTPEEPPECAWCPICRAARMMRGSGPGLASHMAAAGDTLATVVLEAVSTVEAALAAAQRAAAENGAAAGPETDPGKEGEHSEPAPTPENWRVTSQDDAGPATSRRRPADEQDPAEKPAAPQTSGEPPHEPDHRG